MDQDKKRIIIALAINSSQELLLPISDSESDDEDEGLFELINSAKKPRTQIITRIKNYYESVIPNYTARQFQMHFRMNRVSFEALASILLPKLNCRNKTGRQTKSERKHILAVIWLLATPDSYRSVSDRFDLGKSTLSNSFTRIVKCLTQIAGTIIKWPTETERLSIIEEFRAFAGFDKVIGAVDGTYVPIKAPKEHPEVYITRKRNYAMTLQCIAIPSLKFIDSFIGYPGSVTDTRIFMNSPIYQEIRENLNQFFNNNYILGDKAYPLLRFLLPPYIERRPLTIVQNNYNTKHSKTRQVVERSFSLLFGRFRRLKYLDMNRVDLIPSTVIACCVLHNICIDSADLFLNDYIQEGDNFLQDAQDENEVLELQNEAVAVNDVRDAIALSLFTDDH